jgi:hypothetical protein
VQGFATTLSCHTFDKALATTIDALQADPA